jgi:membrane protease YdiL (CAAX protease family)
LSFSCILAAYLEESFFRFYILSRRDELKLSAIPAMIVSVALFSICHIYEGPWGFLNAFLSAVILAFVFLRYNALHGIAIAHGLYNIAVYFINAMLTRGAI